MTIKKKQITLETHITHTPAGILESLGLGSSDHKAYYDPETGWLIQCNDNQCSYIVECLEKHSIVNIYS
jgi:hypothetical protein